MTNDVGVLALVIDGKLKKILIELARKERRTQTVIVEQALRNLFISKKILAGYGKQNPKK